MSEAHPQTLRPDHDGYCHFRRLDAHKKTIAVATVEGRTSADVRFLGTITNTPEAIRSMLKNLAMQPLDGRHVGLGSLQDGLYHRATGSDLIVIGTSPGVDDEDGGGSLALQ